MKKSIKLLLLAALAWPAIAMAQGQEPQQAPAKAASLTPEKITRLVTVADGTTTNQFAPITGNYYASTSTRSQMIYPQNLLTGLNGKEILSVTFYAPNGIQFENGELTIKLGNCEANRYNNNPSMQQFIGTPVSGTVTPVKNATSITVKFDSPFTYTSGNLLVDVTVGVGGTNGTTYFIGTNNNNRQSLYQYNNTLTRQYFLPKISFGYEADAPVSGNTEFFSQSEFDYTWKVNGVGQEEHSAKLTDIATDPDQIIALLKKVYTDPNIPGNYKRGFTSAGLDDHDSNVIYPGVGTINSSHQWVDSYGWNIKGNVIDGGTPNYYHYWYMDPNQYKPNQEGVTLLLLEMVDDFKYAVENQSITESTSDYAKLREYVSKAIKSVRLITESKRTGSGFDAGTLFKIDCDKMNKFYLIAKGQLLWFSPTMESSYYTTPYNNPCYINSRYVDFGLSHEYLETCAFLGHMFEQFSPSTGTSSGEESKPRDDIYQDLVTDMETFGVLHDCPNVPYIGHHFMMYGEDSHSADCADVRDMLFFVPDYRMMAHNNRSAGSNSSRRDYFNYNPDHQPTMGVFGIHQDEIPAGNEIESQRYTDDPDKSKWKSLYHHQLQWWSNLDEFLPNDEQYYELWEIVTDEFGVEKYQQVYYRNAQGEYKLQNGGWYSGDTTGHSQDFVPIVLNRDDANPFNAQNPNNADKQIVKMKYPDVYVDMKAGSQIKTYVIRGRDKGAEGGEPFLSLQWSNLEQVIIPGLDPNEKVRLIGATYYSRYNPDSEKNCYSNKLEMKNNALGLKEADLANNLLFYRSSRAAQIDENGNVKTDEKGNILYAQEADKKLFATGSISSGNQLLTITLVPGLQSPQSDFPVGKHDGLTAGYHANNNLKFTYSIKNGYVDFGNLYFWDNFTADVSKNTHPARYLYKMEVGDAYSNDVPVPVYKTDSKINGALTIDQVVADTQMNPDYKPVDDVKFDAKVQLSSKSEILRYDAYRWPESEKRYLVDYGGDTDDKEEDFDPTGIAQNQDGYYTVTMNADTVPYYYVAPASALPHVDEANPTNWATFVDKYPKNQGEVDAYVYAPVVELFTKGYYEELNNDKQVKRRDYNTYGGPLKRTALGKLEVKAYEPTEKDKNTDMAQMSEYKWFKDGDWYSYYNIYLNFTALDVPEGYELYKVRAWRQVEGGKNVLGEEVSTRESRAVNGWYMYEDMNFGDPLEILPEGSATQPEVMRYSKLRETSFNLGHRSNKIAKPVNPDGTGGGPVFEYDLTPNPNADNAAVENLIKSEMRATFGAKRLKTPDDDSGSLDELNAKFKVRAYFTKNTNPLTNASTTPDAEPIYVIGDIGNGWSDDIAAAELYSDNGTRYTGHIDIPGTNGKGYIRFTRKRSTPGEFFGANAEGNWIVNDKHYNTPLELKYWNSNSRPFEIPAGSYNLTIDLKPLSEAGDDNGWDAGTLTITRGSVAANAPRRAAMPGSDYDYYIAEGETDNIRLEGSSIITGISGVKADLNREVVSVTYVNPLGQQSSRPFSGVNMVITRYSDGSATTTKVVK